MPIARRFGFRGWIPGRPTTRRLPGAGGARNGEQAALIVGLQIATYWAGSGDYATRAANLLSGNGVPLLDASVVMGNGGGNTLIGYHDEQALLYTDGLDTIVDFSATSRQVKVSP